MAIQGTISEWHDTKGYGYISVDDQEAQIKFHLCDLEAYGHPPRISERVQFRLAKDAQGGIRAVNVERQVVFNFSLSIAIWFFTTLVASVFLLDYPPLSFVLYIALSTIAYMVYALDKHALHTGGWRVPSLTFHVLNIVGGWPGALLAQSVLHHKYNDIGYKSLFWLTLFANFGLFCWTLTKEGTVVMVEFLAEMQRLLSF
ncbi:MULTISPECIES: DUF1294 domain-containing protein [Vibrio]|uniref:DUF1294 domain-containing protein n=1 Tax=Vibrio TaxID=662 RepID=UPI0001B95459|nr:MULTISPECIES: DUF1294 domain-containing protein [Vibrio]EEX33350.1 predicted membrane protein [Vibrio coralliilyticus ATCC BAA-450]MCM5508402.1 cold shock and DUF1294 domain-containing protein [Vibrio sp. SCSIO 43169]MDE3897108.1 cold shock and DUF1294 domain-containing protein [Vibrio sp. CC007]